MAGTILLLDCLENFVQRPGPVQPFGVVLCVHSLNSDDDVVYGPDVLSRLEFDSLT
jgi:hypothetical protein